MRVVYIGTSSFATHPLLTLQRSRHSIAGVVTKPDSHAGRGLHTTFSPVKLIARKMQVALLQPVRIGSTDTINALRKLDADIFVVASFGQILPKSVLEIPRHYAINIHPSLLPKYRGAAPVNWAIVRGETVTGVSIFKMTEGMDDGEIILQRKVPLEPTDTALSLSERLSKISGQLLLEVLELIEKEKVRLIAQESSKATYAPKLTKENGKISWNATSQQIHDHIRGMVPWPGAFTHLDNRSIKIWESVVPDQKSAGDAAPGSIIALGNEGITVKTGNGVLIIRILQAAGGKKMHATAYCRGHHLRVGQRFT